MNKQEKLMAMLLGLCLVGWLWYSFNEQKKAAELRSESGGGRESGGRKRTGDKCGGGSGGGRGVKSGGRKPAAVKESFISEA